MQKYITIYTQGERERDGCGRKKLYKEKVNTRVCVSPAFPGRRSRDLLVYMYRYIRLSVCIYIYMCISTAGRSKRERERSVSINLNLARQAESDSSRAAWSLFASIDVVSGLSFFIFFLFSLSLRALQRKKGYILVLFYIYTPLASEVFGIYISFDYVRRDRYIIVMQYHSEDFFYSSSLE